MTWYVLTYLIGAATIIFVSSTCALIFGVKWTEHPTYVYWLFTLFCAVFWPPFVLFGWLIEYLIGDYRDNGRWM